MGKQRAIAKAVLLFLGIKFAADLITTIPNFCKTDSILFLLLSRICLYAICILVARYLIIKNDWLICRITRNTAVEHSNEFNFQKLTLILASVFSGIYIAITNKNYLTFLLSVILDSRRYIQNLLGTSAAFGNQNIRLVFGFLEQSVMMALAIAMICVPVLIANKIIKLETSAPKGGK